MFGLQDLETTITTHFATTDQTPSLPGTVMDTQRNEKSLDTVPGLQKEGHFIWEREQERIIAP